MEKIIITFPDGNKREYDAGITAEKVAQTISISLSKKAISADLDGNHWDLQWPIYKDAELSINTLKNKERAIELVRHDLAHIMARAVQEIWPKVKVTIGPVINHGWYYDFEGALENGVILPPHPDNPGVFELKNPNQNIKGVVR